LEEVVAAELRAFPIEALDVRPGASGVYFVGTKKTGVLANVWLRSAVRVLVELRHGWLDSTAPGGAAVYDFVRYAAPWPEVVPEATRATFSFESRVRSCSDVTSTKLAATRAKDAVCDALVDANGWRPPPPARGHASADVPLFLSLYRDEATLYRDMSGESLHRRGYRDAAIHRAALNESAAAGLLALAGWTEACAKARSGASSSSEGSSNAASPYVLPVLVDPMCGSGTLLVEAALIAGMVAPGLIRADASKRRNERDTVGTEFVDDGSGSFVPSQQTSYAFERWPDHDRALLDEALLQAEAIGADARKALRVAPTLIGNDAHGGALSLARRAAVAAGVDGMISFTQGDCGDLTHPALEAAREAELEYFEKLEAEAGENFRENNKYGDGFVDLEKLGPVTARPGGGGVLVVSNPPWGKRLDVGGERDAEGQRRSAKRWGSDGADFGADFGGEDDDDSFVDDVDDEIREEDADETQSAWHSLGAFFRRECAGATAHLLSGDAGATRPLKMRAKRKRVLGIGGVDCRLLEYRILPPKREKNLDELVREAREEEAI
jgi:23S rRNA G2445 N2-methylase RlmL